MDTEQPTGDVEGGERGGDQPGPVLQACPVWVQGRCDGVTCNCAASGGGR